MFKEVEFKTENNEKVTMQLNEAQNMVFEIFADSKISDDEKNKLAKDLKDWISKIKK